MQIPVRDRVWRAAVYIRLSKDDGMEESLSVANQRKIIEEFLENQFCGAYEIEGYFIDDGESGTDYDRPAFRRMLDAVRTGQIDCIICKNLSRMFRNYADQGYFLEKVFPKYRIRFLTVSEPLIDTFLHPETLEGLEIPINGLMNDRYAAKTSRDVRATLATKRRKGEFIGAFAPYGYQKSPDNRNVLLPDPEAAEIVRKIYRWFVTGGMSKNGIARRLNELGFPNPAAYKQQRGLKYQSPQAEKNDGLWSPRSVSCILQNPVYTGTMVQGRQRVVSYKIHEKRSVPASEWYVVPDTHEPIIDAGDFQRAQELQHYRGRAVQGRLHRFSGLVYCAGCGKAMTRQRSKGKVYYYCRTYRSKSRTHCTRHTLREEKLDRAVLDVLQLQCALATGLAETAEAIRCLPLRGGPGPGERLADCRRAAARVQRLADGLYEDWKNGDLSKEEYLRLKSRYTEQLQRLQLDMERAQRLAGQGETLQENPELAFFLAHRKIRTLTRGLLTALIEKIAVQEGGALEIGLRFADPFQKHFHQSS